MSKPSKQLQLRDELRAVGMRATRSRIAVLQLLRSAREPMSHADVADRFEQEAWDRATIYRNLVDLAESGLLRRTDVGDHVWRFEVVGGEHDTKAHPHFVCKECGTIECLPDASVALSSARTPRAVRLRQVEVHVRGVCDNCQ